MNAVVHVSHLSTKVVVSTSDDGMVKLWDARKKKSMATLNCDYPVTVRQQWYLEWEEMMYHRLYV